MRPSPKWLLEAGDRIASPPAGQPAILYYDIETAPQLQYAWGSGKWDTRPLKVVKPRYHLSVSYQWEGDDTIHFVGLNQNPKFRPDHPWTKPRPGIDRWVLGALWHLFDRADMTIAHNNIRFDLKRTRARMMTTNMNPPQPSKDMDTLRMYRTIAAFPSNKLGELARELGIDGKHGHAGLAMWFACMEGDDEMWTEMETYNRQDITVLRDVYLRIMPWMTNNQGLNAAAFGFVKALDSRPVECPKPACGGTHLIARGTKQLAASGLKYRVWQCVGQGGCGGYSANRYAERETTPTRDRIK